MADLDDMTSFAPKKESPLSEAADLIPSDSFERIEAEILEEAGQHGRSKLTGFTEDYNSMEEETTFDQQIATVRGLQKQSNLDELEALDLQWKLEHEKELAEKALERLEVAALIKKAEETLLPTEEQKESSEELHGDVQGEVSQETEELNPQLVMLDSILSSADLLRMESSDLSEDEGFRLRLSCILEESESDTGSGSGVIKLSRAKELTKLLTEYDTPKPKPVDLEIQTKFSSKCEGIAENKTMELAERPNVKQDALFEEPNEILDRDNALDMGQTFAHVENNSNEELHQPDAEDNKPMGDTTEDELLDSVGSSSPEPNFGIQRMKSGTKVNKFTTSPVLKKRLESSSDSSFDLSTPATSPSVEDAVKSIETIKTAGAEIEDLPLEEEPPIAETKPPEVSPAGSNQNISIHSYKSGISKSATPENVRVEMANSNEQIVRDNAAYNIKEVTDEEIQAMFPKVKKRGRGKSEEKEVRQRSDSQSVKSFDIRGAAARVKALFPKIKKIRGRSLDSGMAEKKRQEMEKIQAEGKGGDDHRQQKGTSEPPPVPPETYLWEELRRWRIKGGYPWTYLDKPPFDEKTWKNQTDHEYEPINPPPLNSIAKTNEEVEGNENKDVEFNDTHFLRIPRDDELVVSPEDMEVEAIGAARQFQDDLEDRFLATSMTATTASRTDCDVNTSMLDSSGLEDLPLKRDSRTKKALQNKTEQMRAQAQGLQQRIRSQAGKLRSKLRSLPRPSFSKRQERQRGEEEQEKAPRFKLPERPKFNLPERPKFKFPQKPKINLQNLTKPLRERQARSSGEQKKNIFDIDFKTYPRMFNKNSKDRSDFATSSPKMGRNATPPPAPMQPARKKGPIGQRWVNRFDDIKFVDDRASQMSQPSGRSDGSESLSGFHDRDFAIADDFDHEKLPPPRAVSTKSSMSRGSELEPQSSRSSVDHIGKGVLEEIDSDQFFLRQKGLSENDINMEKYLSDEIREAFRSPVVNALRQLDADYEEPLKEPQNLQGKENQTEEPLVPARVRSLKRARKIPSQDDEVICDEGELNKPRYENFDKNNEVTKPRYDNLEEDNASEYYKSPPSPREYQHYKVPRPTPIKRKSNSIDKPINKKKENGWVEVEIETELEVINDEEAPLPIQRRKSKKSMEPKQISYEAAEPEPDYIIPEEVPPEAPKRTRSLHSLAKDIVDHSAPTAPKRTSSKSIHSIGLTNEKYQKDPDTRSIHSIAYDDRRGATVPRRIKNLSKGYRSYQSLSNGETADVAPAPPERTRSLSRASKASCNYLADDEKSWVPQAPDRTRSLSRKSAARQIQKNEEPVAETSNTKETSNAVQVNHYGAPCENGFADYAVIEKVKPPRPPQPRRRKGSRSPVFNTFPRRSPSGSGPVRPVRNYATLGPSRPERKTKKKPAARSVEHIYSSDQMSQSYLEVEGGSQQTEDIHGSNKDLQASEVVEKMKTRPLPAPPRPPRLKGKSEEQNPSMEEIEEVCVSTQTDPLPDDVCLEDDIIQEFSHEQLKSQEAFLKEMREEEERIQREIEAKRQRNIDVTAEHEENETKMEIIRQMDDIIREERRLLENERRIGGRFSPHEEKKKAQLDVQDDDMGYASLDRRQNKLEDDPQPSTSFQQPRQQTLILKEAETINTPETSAQITEPPPKPPANLVLPAEQPLQPVYVPMVPEIVSTERLRVGHLEVDRLSVGQLDALNLAVQNTRTQTVDTTEIRAASLQVQDISSHSGNLSIRNLELPPELINELISRIPWEQLRPPTLTPAGVSLQTTVPGDQGRTPSEDDFMSSHSSQAAAMRRRRSRHVRHSTHSRTEDSSEDDRISAVRRQPRYSSVSQEQGVGELAQGLAQACTTATVRALQNFSDRVRPPPEGEERTRYVQAVLLVALIAIVGYILMGFNGRSMHHHHWDFQFPPQPPSRQ